MINPNLTSFPAMTFQFLLVSISPSLLEQAGILFKHQFDSAGHRVISVAAPRPVAALYCTNCTREICIALFLGFCWTASLIKALLLIYFVVCKCQMSFLPCLWIRNGCKLNYKSFQETFKMLSAGKPILMYSCDKWIKRFTWF